MAEQQVPKVDPAHVLPLLPQRPSVVIFDAPLPQVPKLAWQPALQNSLVVPQYPEAEQQVPNVDPAHVFPLLPQRPSVLIVEAPLPQVPNPV